MHGHFILCAGTSSILVPNIHPTVGIKCLPYTAFKVLAVTPIRRSCVTIALASSSANGLSEYIALVQLIKRAAIARS